MPRVFAICLDGYEESVGEELMSAGKMPALRALKEDSARFRLDHGAALRTGLAGEHVATGLSPEAAHRWAAVYFDPVTYSVWQEGTSLTPFPAALRSKSVVFDVPYFDLSRAANVRGIVNWGAHDPGVAPASNPLELLHEAMSRFGEYPALRWIYGTPWNSPGRAKEMGDRLADAVRLRGRLISWIFKDRLPDWDLALATVSEAHSAIEGLWHGVDASHPLHNCPSADAASEGIHSVYLGIDALIGDVRTTFPDATVVVFSMHGMGPNWSDAASMVLLPELMYRRAFGKALFARQGTGSIVLHGRPAMDESDNWDAWIKGGFPAPDETVSGNLIIRFGKRVLPSALKNAISSRVRHQSPDPSKPLRLPVDWMPAGRYQPFWRAMPAFALPSYYDGRVRINLKGREREGIVDPNNYKSMCAEIALELHSCKDSFTGESIVEEIEYGARGDPKDLSPTEADLIVVWRGGVQGIVHPKFGQIGPVPYRRTGGHTGGHGFAYINSSAIAPTERGLHSAHDIVPTLVGLLGEGPLKALSGVSLFQDPQRPG